MTFEHTQTEDKTETKSTSEKQSTLQEGQSQQESQIISKLFKSWKDGLKITQSERVEGRLREDYFIGAREVRGGRSGGTMIRGRFL